MSFSYTSKLLLYCTMNELCYISNHQNFWRQSLIDFASYLYEEFCAASYTTRNIWSKSLIQFGSYILPRIVCSVIYYQKKMVFNGMRSCVRCAVMTSEDEASLVCLRCREKEDGNRSSKAMNPCEGCNLFFAPISGEKACQVVLKILLAQFQHASLVVAKVCRRQKATMILVVVLVEI